MRVRELICQVRAGRILSHREDNSRSFHQMWSTSSWTNKKRAKKEKTIILLRILSKYNHISCDFLICSFYFIVSVLPSSCFRIRILRVCCNYIESAECAKRFMWRLWCRWTKSLVGRASEQLGLDQQVRTQGMPSQSWDRLCWLIQTRLSILLMTWSASKVRGPTKKRSIRGYRWCSRMTTLWLRVEQMLPSLGSTSKISKI